MFEATWNPLPGRRTGEISLDRLLVPSRWGKPQQVLVSPKIDLFHEAVPDEWIARVFNVMADASQHTYQIFTKHSKRMQRILYGPKSHTTWDRRLWHRSVLPNVWLGVSVEDQATADERIPHLLATPAAKRVVKANPLGSMDIERFLRPSWGELRPSSIGGLARPLLPALDWVIVSGEVGRGARPCDVAWVRSIRDQCRATATPLFVERLGSCPYDSDRMQSVPGHERVVSVSEIDDESIETIYRCIAAASMTLFDRDGSDPAEWDDDLRVRQRP